MVRFGVLARLDTDHLVRRVRCPKHPRRGLELLARREHQRQSLQTARDRAPVGQLSAHLERVSPQRNRTLRLTLTPQQIAERRQRVTAGIERIRGFGGDRYHSSAPRHVRWTVHPHPCATDERQRHAQQQDMRFAGERTLSSRARRQLVFVAQIGDHAQVT
jgi:hypothetical protein